MSAAPFVVDPFAPGFAAGPYPHYARPRAEAPAHEHPLGFWTLSGFADVAAPQWFSHSFDEANLTRPADWESDSSALGGVDRVMGGPSMRDQDRPDRARMRRLMANAAELVVTV
ncbi:hypothetical protein [Nocardia aurantiaca]|uniref:Uncharacterized protein n=1 Tax=Nocardia aurantiaca TaxID=2675850 RepID=A0A6I3L5Q7_9NOCA|nr:hypothetical protein [Nocardia aurantiaca]MTE15865.1 hypothetical protein [Nocardia aurantiaca]